MNMLKFKKIIAMIIIIVVLEEVAFSGNWGILF